MELDGVQRWVKSSAHQNFVHADIIHHAYACAPCYFQLYRFICHNTSGNSFRWSYSIRCNNHRHGHTHLNSVNVNVMPLSISYIISVVCCYQCYSKGCKVHNLFAYDAMRPEVNVNAYTGNARIGKVLFLRCDVMRQQWMCSQWMCPHNCSYWICPHNHSWCNFKTTYS